MNSIFYDALQGMRQLYWRIFQIKTSGVRVIIEKDKSFLLVKHRFGGPWLFPGGGIKKHESVEQAAIREVQEETSFTITSFSRRLGVYKNNSEGKRDTITILIAREWKAPKRKRWNLEIKDSEFFSLDSLPEGTSPATHKRIAEYLSSNPKEFVGDW